MLFRYTKPKDRVRRYPVGLCTHGINIGDCVRCCPVIREKPPKGPLNRKSKKNGIPRIKGKMKVTKNGVPQKSPKIDIDKYYRSSHWKNRRNRYWKNHEKICAICGVKENIHLHHISYLHLGKERDSDLMPLCESHHMELHEFVKANRLTVYKGTKKFLEK